MPAFFQVALPMSNSMTTRPFISYARADNVFASRLATRLKENGVNVWIDVQDIPVGARWDDEVDQALNATRMVLLVISPNAVGSQNVRDEIARALKRGYRILPVLLQECEVPFNWERLQYVDFTEASRDNFPELLRQLLQATPSAATDGTSSVVGLDSIQIGSVSLGTTPVATTASAARQSLRSSVPVSTTTTRRWWIAGSSIASLVAAIVGWLLASSPIPYSAGANNAVAGARAPSAASAASTSTPTTPEVLELAQVVPAPPASINSPHQVAPSSTVSREQSARPASSSSSQGLRQREFVSGANTFISPKGYNTRIYFSNGSAQLDSDSLAAIDAILQSTPDPESRVLYLVGAWNLADKTESAEQTRQRIRTIIGYLQEKGFPKGHIVVRKMLTGYDIEDTKDHAKARFIDIGSGSYPPIVDYREGEIY